MNNFLYYIKIFHLYHDYLHVIIPGDYVTALNVLNEFVEFVKAYINIGIRGNYNVILRR